MNIRKCREKSGRFVYLRFVHIFIEERSGRITIFAFSQAKEEKICQFSLFFSTVCGRIDILSEAGYYYVQHKASAMHNFRGLRNFRLPYQALESTIKKIQTIGVSNSLNFMNCLFCVF